MQQIPKIIHYCWFGGNPKPQLVLDCIESWKRFCPDYEIREWNEESFDINSVQYVKEAYEAKKWAFVSDYVRLYALVTCGGIYVDSDVQILRPIDRFLCEEAFTGFEVKDSPVTAIMGCAKGQPLFNELLSEYTCKSFYKNGEMDLSTNTVAITKTFVKKGIKLNGKKQKICGCTIYPEIVFCPNNFRRIFYRYSKKSYTVHHFMGSWGGNSSSYKRSFPQRVRMFLLNIGRNTIGTHGMYCLSCWLKGIEP